MKRIAYFDNAKGILIIFIVLAHVLSLCSSYYNYNDDFFKFASLFMLQCFFFISAYFSSQKKENRKKRIIKFLKIYLLWQTGITIYYAFVLNIIKFNLNYWIPRYTLWFLISMITYNLAEIILDKVDAKIMIPISFLLGILSGFIPWIGAEFSLSRSFVFFPFYTIGYYAKDLKILDKVKSPKIKKISIVLFIILLVLILNNNDFLPQKILKGKYNYYEIQRVTLLEACWKRNLFYILSIIVSIGFLNLVPTKNSILTKLGRNTLYIYLTQGAILKTFITEKILLNNHVVGTLLLFVISLILTVIITKLIKEIAKFAKVTREVIHEQKI